MTDADEATVTVTLEFEAPVTRTQLHERFATLAEGLADEGDPLTTLVLLPATGPTRRLRIRPSATPGAAFALEESIWTKCAWHHAGREELDRVEVDGVRYGREVVEHCGGP